MTTLWGAKVPTAEVYITQKSSAQQRLNFALEPSRALQRLSDLKCDGRHPYEGVVPGGPAPSW